MTSAAAARSSRMTGSTLRAMAAAIARFAAMPLASGKGGSHASSWSLIVVKVEPLEVGARSRHGVGVDLDGRGGPGHPGQQSGAVPLAGGNVHKVRTATEPARSPLDRKLSRSAFDAAA